MNTENIVLLGSTMKNSRNFFFKNALHFATIVVYWMVMLVAEECAKICGNDSISAKNIREKFGLI